MGIYSGNELSYSAPIVCEAAEGYDDDVISAQMAMIESHKNSLALFEGAIRCDIQEAAMRANGYNDYDVMVFSENVITSMLSKIKAFLMKVWSKIKAIFRGFMARVDSVMTKSNKEFVNRYRQEVMRKDLTDFEVKWRKPKKQYALTETSFPVAPKAPIPAQAFETKHWTAQGLDALEKHLRDWDQDKIMDAILKETIPGNTSTSASEYEKDFIDAQFEDEDNDDKIDIHDIMSALLDHKESKKTATKANESLEKALKNMIKAIESDEKEFNGKMPGTTNGAYDDLKFKQRKYEYGSTANSKTTWDGKGEDDGDEIDFSTQQKGGTNADAAKQGFANSSTYGDNVKAYQKAIQIIHKYATCYQEAATKYAAVVIKAFKMLNSGLRKVWAKAVAYNRKKDESVLMEAMADLAVWEEDVVEESAKKKRKKGKNGKRKIGDEIKDEDDLNEVKEGYDFISGIQFK